MRHDAHSLRCPRCLRRDFARDGQANGLQRFRCRACGRTFNLVSGVAHGTRVQQQRWRDY